MQSLKEALNIINKSRAISVALPEKAGWDEFAAGQAMVRTLNSGGKRARLLFSGEAPRLFNELFPNGAAVNDETSLSDFIIEVSLKSSPIKELQYDRNENSLNIILTPKDRPIQKENISFRRGKTACDLIVAIGVGKLENIGRAFEESPDFFYETPVVAINVTALGEEFGEVELSDLTKSSVSEITAELLFEFSPESVDKLAATMLLSGIIEKTKNFSNGRTRPSTFAAAAGLVERGANLDEIVRVLKKTKPLSLLQLWGRASIRSRIDDERKTLISFLTKDDFLKTGVVPEDSLPFVLDRIEEHFALPENFALLWQHPEREEIRVLFKSPNHAANKEAAPYTANHGYRELTGPFASFQEAEEAIHSLLAK